MSLYQEALIGAQIVSLLSRREDGSTLVDLEEELSVPFRAADFDSVSSRRYPESYNNVIYISH